MNYLIALGLVLMALSGCATTKIVEAQRVVPVKKMEPPSVSAEEKAGALPTLRPIMPQIPLVRPTETPTETPEVPSK